METRKLLVVDTSTSFCAELAEFLGGAYELRTCNDGLQARALLESFCPDILVTDLALPGLDGISLLKAASYAPKRPAMLVTTRFTSLYIEYAITEIGVDYLMVKPCDLRGLADRIHDLSQCEGGMIPMPCEKTSVSNMLAALNVQVKRKGHTYLETAIELYRKDPCQSVTKVLYPTVAKICGGSRDSVERAIRSAIHAAWNRRDEKVWRLYFPTCREGVVPRPSNTTFIATLADLLCKQERQQAQM